MSCPDEAYDVLVEARAGEIVAQETFRLENSGRRHTDLRLVQGDAPTALVREDARNARARGAAPGRASGPRSPPRRVPSSTVSESLTEVLAVVGAAGTVVGGILGIWNLAISRRQAREGRPHFTAAWSGLNTAYVVLRVTNGPHPTTLLEMGIGPITRRALRAPKRVEESEAVVHLGPIEIEAGRTVLFRLMARGDPEEPPFADLDDVGVWVVDGRTNAVNWIPREQVRDGWQPFSRPPVPTLD